MVEIRKRGQGNTPYAMKKEGYVSIVGLSRYVKNAKEAKRLRTAVANSPEFHAVVLVDESGNCPKYWYKKDQIDNLLKYIRSGDTPGQGLLFPSADEGAPAGDKADVASQAEESTEVSKDEPATSLPG